jgi:hypothetical protein
LFCGVTKQATERTNVNKIVERITDVTKGEKQYRVNSWKKDGGK